MNNPPSPSRDNSPQTFLGKYSCPRCNIHLTIPMAGNIERLLLIIRLPENRYLNPHSPRCPHCRRKMLLESIVDRSGAVVIDVYHWMGQEITRMKRNR